MNKYAKAVQLLTNGIKNGVPMVDQNHNAAYVVAGLLSELHTAGLIQYQLGAGASIGDELRAAIASREVNAARVLFPRNLGGNWDLSD